MQKQTCKRHAEALKVTVSVITFFFIFSFVLGLNSFINESIPTYNSTMFLGERQTSKLI